MRILFIISMLFLYACDQSMEIQNPTLFSTLKNSNGEITPEIETMIKEKLITIKLQEELLRRNLSSSEKEKKENEEERRRLERTVSESSDPTIIQDIIDKLFEPCTTTLKADKYCYLSGALIYRLGGQFIDPTKFKKTKRELLSYLTLSGVESKAATTNMESYIDSAHPDLMQKCFQGKKYAIAPQKLWPRLIVLTLVFEKMEKDLLKQREVGLLPASVKPINSFVSWYRNQCYHNGLKCKTNPANCGRKFDSDHIYAAALDGSFRSQPSKETFKFYKDFLEDKMIKRDVFNVIKPLKNSNLTISLGVGLGNGTHGKGKLHLGIMSEIDGGDGIRTWRY